MLMLYFYVKMPQVLLSTFSSFKREVKVDVSLIIWIYSANIQESYLCPVEVI